MNTKLKSNIKTGTGVLFSVLIAISIVFPVKLVHAQSGQDLFKQNCAACHRADDRKMVGPGLKGITKKRSSEWLNKWIKDSQSLIKSGNPDAVAIYEEYNKAIMTPFQSLSDDNIASILAYVDEANSSALISSNSSTQPSATLSNSNTATTSTSENKELHSTEKTVLYTLLVIALSLLAFVIATYFKAKNVFETSGHAAPDKQPDFKLVFLIMLSIAGIIIYGLKTGLENGSSSLSNFVFATFPYVAFATLIIGSVYRYVNRGFQISSLSSQFLEGRKLFWASQPFHWGMLVLFLGHLVAFLFPRTLLAWNGSPVRLIILEVTAFVFALSTLYGLGMFIRRRLTNDRVLIVTNKMDMLVYVVLSVQVVSGLGVAFFARWGSSWFASALTPYLRSIFAFNPEIGAVSAMPWYIQIHIISAFSIIAIIPFTRFVHFLVAPVDYIWRRYQLVIWNWNNKAIRNSTYHFPGKRTKNN